MNILIQGFYEKYYFIYLKDRAIVRGRREEGRERDGERYFLSLIHSLKLPQWLGLAQTEPRIQKLPLSLLHRNRGPKGLGCPALTSQMHWQGAGLEVEQQELEPVLIWNAGIVTSKSVMPQCQSVYKAFYKYISSLYFGMPVLITYVRCN